MGCISETEIIEAVKTITPYGWAKGKGFDKVKLVTPIEEFEELGGNINNLNDLLVIYHK